MFFKQTIVTKYLPATNTKPQRIRAMTSSGITSVWSVHDPVFKDVSYSNDDMHFRAAETLARELLWLEDNTLHGGALPKQTGFRYCFVLIPK